MRYCTVCLIALLLSPLVTVQAADTGMKRSPAPNAAEAYFITPNDGATVSSPVTVRFGLKNMGVAPAGVDKEQTGHHHLLINTDLPPLNQPIPNDTNHRHFGGGQTQTSLDLEPGTYTLQLLLGDHRHIPHDPPVKSERITITVESGE